MTSPWGRAYFPLSHTSRISISPILHTSAFKEEYRHAKRTPSHVTQALAEVAKQYALGEKASDAAAMTGDLQLKGNILLEMGKADDAKKAFDQAVKTTADSGLSQAVKDNTALFSHYNLARVAIAKKDLATAKAETETFRKGAEAAKNANQLKQAHELVGRIALEEKNYDNAIAELGQAYQGKGDAANAKASFTKAAKFNSLPALNYAFVRTKAEKALAT